MQKKKPVLLSDDEFKAKFSDEFLLTTAQASMLLSVSEDTLNHWRSGGKGPKFLKLIPSSRGSVRYQLGDLRNWIKERTVKSAAEGMLLKVSLVHLGAGGPYGELLKGADFQLLRHHFIVRKRFIFDYARYDKQTFLDSIADPFTKFRFLTIEEALCQPWIRADHRKTLLREYLMTPGAKDRGDIISERYKINLRRVHLFGGHPDLTMRAYLESLPITAEEYPVQVAPMASSNCSTFGQSNCSRQDGWIMRHRR
jgi:hypothetical protein